MELAVFFSTARFSMGRAKGRAGGSFRKLVLWLTGGMVIGALATDAQWRQISSFWEGMFHDFLILLLLEMGMRAIRQILGFARVGRFMTGFGTLFPIFNGAVGVTAGYLTGMSLGGAFVQGSICASASFSDPPAACRAALEKENPGIHRTSSLRVTLPFSLLFGPPLCCKYAEWLFSW